MNHLTSIWMLLRFYFVPKKRWDLLKKWLFKHCVHITLYVQKFMFKLAMKSNAKVVLGLQNTISSLTKMWRIITNFVVLFHNISKYWKLVKSTMIQMLRPMEDEWTFIMCVCNYVCVHMFGHSFFYNVNFLLIKLWTFGQQTSINMFSMLKGSSIVGCPLPSACIPWCLG